MVSLFAVWHLFRRCLFWITLYMKLLCQICQCKKAWRSVNDSRWMICMIESGKITILLSLYRLITLNIAVSLIKICSTDLVFIQNIIHSCCHKGCYLIIFSRLSIMQVILNFLRVFKNMYENQAHTEHLNVSYNSLDYMKFVQIFSLRDNGKNIFIKTK